MNLPRHDDLENPPDFCELRDDYWQLWDQHKAAEMCHANNMDEVTKQRDALAEKVRWMEEQEALYTMIECSEQPTNETK